MTDVSMLQRARFGRVLETLPLTCIDVGARSEFDPDLRPIAYAVNAIGFEPHPEECARLQDAFRHGSPWKTVTFLPLALSGEGGKRTLNVPDGNEGASLLEHDVEFGRGFPHLFHYFNVVRRIDVDTVSLDTALDSSPPRVADYLKLDVEGAELEILRGAPKALESLLAIKTEVSFARLRRGQPTAAEVDVFLQSHGFRLMDFAGEMRWRRRSGVPHPQVRLGDVPYSKGQLMHGDYLYFRDIDYFRHDSEHCAKRAIQAASLAMVWGFFDHALLLLSLPHVQRYLVSNWELLPNDAVKEASLLFGRHAWSRACKSHARLGWTFLRSLPAILTLEAQQWLRTR